MDGVHPWLVAHEVLQVRLDGLSYFYLVPFDLTLQPERKG